MNEAKTPVMGAVLLALALASVALSSSSFLGVLAPEHLHPTAAGPAVFILLLLAEGALLTAFARVSYHEAVTQLGACALPFLLLLAGFHWVPFSGAEGLVYPDRQMGAVMGVAWMLHLSLFASCLAYRALARGKRTIPAAFLAASLVLFGGSALQTTRCELSGDEPHYLLMAYSLIHDGDLDLSNNYDNHHAEAFYKRGILEPQGNEHLLPNGKRYSHHPLGPVLLILPGFLVASRLGASLTVAVLAALCLSLALRAFLAFGAKPSVVEKAGWAGLFVSPLLLYAGLVFAEVPTALALSIALWCLATRRYGALGAALGLLLWMHNRNVLLVIPSILAALAAAKDGKLAGRDFGRMALGFALPVIPLAIYFNGIYGAVSPLAAHNEAFGSLFSLPRFVINFPGLLMDQESGLWFTLPLSAAVPAGVVLGARKGGAFKAAAFALLAYWAAMCFYQNLGLQPPARYFAGVTPLILLCLLPVFERLEGAAPAWRRLVVTLAGMSTFMNLTLSAVPWLKFNPLTGQNRLLDFGGRLLHLPLNSWEPSFLDPNALTRSLVLSLFWMSVAAALTFGFVRDARGRDRS